MTLSRSTSPKLCAPLPRGFTLLEVVMALLVLEVAVMGVMGTLLLASRTLYRAERLERATGRAEAVVDSLRGAANPDTATSSHGDVFFWWSVDGEGRVNLLARDVGGDTLLHVETRVGHR